MINFYVYIHIDPRTQERVYVGKGCCGRAWDVTRNRKKSNPLHEAWMQELYSLDYLPNDWVHIYHRSLSEDIALKEEKELIHLLCPKFNRQSGELQHQAKLTNEEAIQIYDLAKSKKHKHKDIADTFGVSRTCVSMIASRKQWKAILNKYRKEDYEEVT